MFLARKIGWARIGRTLMTTGILLQGFPPSAAGSDSTKEKVPTFVIKDEIRKMQESLRDKGHYRGKVDGVFGLRTRASIRAYQKAENFPITGEVDTRTADGLGVRPESAWADPKSADLEAGHGSDRASGKIKRDKPSAGIPRVKRRASHLSRKEVPRAAAVEDSHGDSHYQTKR